MFQDRVLSGMRPTGSLHLGHYHGVLKNWVRLQHEYECLFFVADWHALTTHYDDPQMIEQNVWDMVIDWLAAGVDPAQATLFIQSQVPRTRRTAPAAVDDHAAGLAGARADLQGPAGKTRSEKDLSTYGFLGYPLLQKRRHPDLPRQPGAGGRGPGAAHRIHPRDRAPLQPHLMAASRASRKRPRRRSRSWAARRPSSMASCAPRYQEQGDDEALEAARALLDEAQNLVAGRPRAAVRLPRRRRQDDPGRAAGDADRGAPRCRGWTARRCPSPTTTPSRCAKTPAA